MVKYRIKADMLVGVSKVRMSTLLSKHGNRLLQGRFVEQSLSLMDKRTETGKIFVTFRFTESADALADLMTGLDIATGWVHLGENHFSMKASHK